MEHVAAVLDSRERFMDGMIARRDRMSSCEVVTEIGRATEISDGSFKNNRGTASCTIEANNNNNSRIYAVHDTPGNITD